MMPNASKFATPSSAAKTSPYALESSVRRELLKDEGLCFSKLVVRRTPQGVCLEGVLELDQCVADADLMSAALRVAGVGTVQNNLVTRTTAKPAASTATANIRNKK